MKGKDTDRSSARKGMSFFHESPLAHSSPVHPSRPSSEYSQYSSMIYSRPHSISSTASNSNNTSEKNTPNTSSSPPLPNPISASSFLQSSHLKSMESVSPERPSLVVDTTTPLIGFVEADLKNNIFPFMEAAMSKPSSPLDRDAVRTSTPYNDSPPNEMHINYEQSKSRSRRGSFNDQYSHTQNTPQYPTGFVGGVANNGNSSSSSFNNNKNSPSTTVNNVFGLVTVTSNPPTPINCSSNNNDKSNSNNSKSSNSNLRIRWTAIDLPHSIRYPPSRIPNPWLFHTNNFIIPMSFSVEERDPFHTPSGGYPKLPKLSTDTTDRLLRLVCWVTFNARLHYASLYYAFHYTELLCFDLYDSKSITLEI